MEETEKIIISIFRDTQKEYIELFSKNSPNQEEINKFNESQNIKFVEFRNKLIEYRNKIISEIDKPIKKSNNIDIKDSYNWWEVKK